MRDWSPVSGNVVVNSGTSISYDLGLINNYNIDGYTRTSWFAYDSMQNYITLDIAILTSNSHVLLTITNKHNTQLTCRPYLSIMYVKSAYVKILTK